MLAAPGSKCALTSAISKVTVKLNRNQQAMQLNIGVKNHKHTLPMEHIKRNVGIFDSSLIYLRFRPTLRS